MQKGYGNSAGVYRGKFVQDLPCIMTHHRPMPQIASIIHRKARGGTGVNRGHRMSPVKALRLGLARAADSLFDLALTVSMVE